ncbi:short-chain dehydrogenase [Paenibacillus sp. 32O-W]|uniref:SDR family oxidoreductase n=1 Tax=Paenibacillus sp. 32O-W TaxID=1695218 RepID=UPI00071FE483|nr:SDR family oxidoreductase [Paenibacillus sp. 32O-W]ALS28324.1 short-chain dehydrogenase [Paenibacillus sp. 32O-W]
MTIVDDSLKGKIAIVCASSRGLGYATARRLAQGGALVTMLSRSEKNVAEAAAAIERETGIRPLAYACDVSKAEDIRRVVADTVKERGGLHILVNNAGGPPAGTFASFGDEDWMRAHELNFMSVVRFVREALPHMKNGGGGSIVNIISVSVKQPMPNLVLSNAYRAAVVGLAKTLADELAPAGIRINNAAPGRIATERIAELDRHRANAEGRSVEEIERESLRGIPAGRYGDPAEFAEAVAFLASDRASYITGATLQVDGGMVRSLQ